MRFEVFFFSFCVVLINVQTRTRYLNTVHVCDDNKTQKTRNLFQSKIIGTVQILLGYISFGESLHVELEYKTIALQFILIFNK